ncbi:hypothetical protein [Sporosarcina highlanderae]|uniref:DUF2929 family protein n=1 Tax=Sporosarcina highlanderae TaxID=3035916 RepID=A0ABT8JWR1_9BACL|nr:hypothetical protein [Sporosarcina highlanderae]MDN4609001.1 hypothetical protein [Sporosarcina highlanderae]
MKSDLLLVLFIIWGIVLVIELIWFDFLTQTPHTISDIAFAMTVIAVTTVIGSTGMFLIKSSKN